MTFMDDEIHRLAGQTLMDAVHGADSSNALVQEVLNRSSGRQQKIGLSMTMVYLSRSRALLQEVAIRFPAQEPLIALLRSRQQELIESYFFHSNLLGTDPKNRLLWDRQEVGPVNLALALEHMHYALEWMPNSMIADHGALKLLVRQVECVQRLIEPHAPVGVLDVEVIE